MINTTYTALITEAETTIIIIIASRPDSKKISKTGRKRQTKVVRPLHKEIELKLMKKFREKFVSCSTQQEMLNLWNSEN